MVENLLADEVQGMINLGFPRDEALAIVRQDRVDRAGSKYSFYPMFFVFYKYFSHNILSTFLAPIVSLTSTAFPFI